MASLWAAFASAEGQATAADAARLQELTPVRRMIFTADISDRMNDSFMRSGARE
jgi:hypothetical protein